MPIKKQYKHWMKAASKDNDGSTIEATGDYSVTPASFQVKSTDYLCLERVIVGITDAAITSSDTYGDLTALTNGVRVYVSDTDDSLIEELTAFPIKSNGDWARHCHDLAVHDSFGVGNDFISVRWTFSKSGYPVVLQPNQYLEFYLNDNFTGLVNHTFIVQGYYYDERY